MTDQRALGILPSLYPHHWNDKDAPLYLAFLMWVWLLNSGPYDHKTSIFTHRNLSSVPHNHFYRHFYYSCILKLKQWLSKFLTFRHVFKLLDSDHPKSKLLFTEMLSQMCEKGWFLGDALGDVGKYFIWENYVHKHKPGMWILRKSLGVCGKCPHTSLSPSSLPFSSSPSLYSSAHMYRCGVYCVCICVHAC